MENIQQQPSNTKRKTILVGMGVAVASVLGYFGWQYWRKKKIQQMDTSAVEQPSSPVQNKPSRTTTRNDNFPLKRGSRGQRVKALQQALIAKYGASILPQYGADGDFGKELEDGLKKANLPTRIDERTFNTLTAQSGSVAPFSPVANRALNHKQVAQDIH